MSHTFVLFGTRTRSAFLKHEAHEKALPIGYHEGNPLGEDGWKQLADFDGRTLVVNTNNKRSPRNFGPVTWAMAGTRIAHTGSNEDLLDRLDQDNLFLGRHYFDREARSSIGAFLTELFGSIGCGLCQKHINAYFAVMPVHLFTRNRNILLCWYWNQHNIVNVATKGKNAVYPWEKWMRECPLFVEPNHPALETPPFLLTAKLDEDATGRTFAVPAVYINDLGTRDMYELLPEALPSNTIRFVRREGEDAYTKLHGVDMGVELPLEVDE